MPLAIRSVNRRVGSTAGFDADAAAYIRDVQSADNAALELAVAHAINAFVLGCKADGIWSAMKASCILMGARTLSGALTPLVGSAPTNNNFVTGDYNRETGLSSGTSNSTKYLNSNRAGNADGQNDYHVAIYASTTSASGQALIGSGGSGSGATGMQNASNNLFARARNTTGDNMPTNAGMASSGFFATGRSDSNTVRYCNTSNADGNRYTATVTRASQTPASDNFFVYGRNSGGNTLAFASSGRFAFYSIGAYCDLALLGTRVATLYTAIGNAIP